MVVGPQIAMQYQLVPGFLMGGYPALQFKITLDNITYQTFV